MTWRYCHLLILQWTQWASSSSCFRALHSVLSQNLLSVQSMRPGDEAYLRTDDLMNVEAPKFVAWESTKMTIFFISHKMALQSSDEDFNSWGMTLKKNKHSKSSLSLWKVKLLHNYKTSVAKITGKCVFQAPLLIFKTEAGPSYFRDILNIFIFLLIFNGTVFLQGFIII